MASPSGGRPPLKVAGCPQVAELIDYAWNRLGGEERQLIEAHLRNGHCRACQSWIDQARRQAPPAVSSSSAPADNPQWLSHAFSDLRDRLRGLDENA